MHVAGCFCLVFLLDFQQQEQQQAKRVPDGHGRPLDHGHGKNMYTWNQAEISVLFKLTLFLDVINFNDYSIRQ